MTELPACLLHSRYQATAGQVAAADPADTEFAIKAARASAKAAAVAMLDRELAGRLRLDLLGLGRHAQPSTAGQRGVIQRRDSSLFHLVVTNPGAFLSPDIARLHQ